MTRVPMGSSIADGKFGYPFGPAIGSAVRRAGRAGAPGHLRRADRRQVGHQRATTSTRSAHRSQQRAASHRTRAGSSARSSRSTVRRRQHASPSTKGLRGRRRSRRSPSSSRAFRSEEDGGRVDAGNSSQITDGASARADHERGTGRPLGLTPRARFDDVRRGRRRPGADAHGTDPGHPQGARAGRDVDRRHRPGRGQRGVRVRRARLGEASSTPTWTRSTSTAARSRSGIRSAPRAPG